MSKTTLIKSRYTISRMFDDIAHRYDLLNMVLSFGLDIKWRKMIASFLPENRPLQLVDLATGTADSLLILLKMPQSQNVKQAIGIDISEKMLEIGKEKVAKSVFSDRVSLQFGDATQLELKDSSSDVVTMMFGIRNVDNVDAALSEIYRVLRKDGRVIILEFSMPKNRLIRWGHLAYFRYILPNIAGLVSGQKDAYNYLNKSSEQFPSGNAFCDCLKRAGFQKVSAHPLCYGVATIYVGER